MIHKLNQQQTFDMVEMITTTAALNLFNDVRRVLDAEPTKVLHTLFNGLNHKVDFTQGVIHMVCATDEIAQSKVRLRNIMSKSLKELDEYKSLMKSLTGELRQHPEETIQLITGKAFEHMVKYYITRIIREEDPERITYRVTYAFVL